jgi:hypothetical protein
MTNDLKNGTKVKFSVSIGVAGEGIIRGIATSGAAVIGKCYIVELTSASFAHEYPCIAVFESQLQVI